MAKKSTNQDLLPGIKRERNFAKEREEAEANQALRLRQLWSDEAQKPDRLYTARLLILCGLPLRKTTEAFVTRKARLPDGNFIRVTFAKAHPQVPMPFGADRTMVYFLTHKAILQQSALLRWEYANEYMHLFKMDTESGKNYQAVQERFTRVALLNITVEYLDAMDNVVDHWKTPIIDHARIAAVVDGEGNWKPSTSIAEMLRAKQAVDFGQRFLTELQEHPVPLPMELVVATDKNYRVMDYCSFIYWRAFAAKTESFIPWRYLMEQFDNNDAHQRRWAVKFKEAKAVIKQVPGPINQIRFDVTTDGIIIYPLPLGWSRFEGFPKLGPHRVLEPES